MYSRFSIDKSNDIRKAFKIDLNNGTITVAKPLDRESADWHNLTITAKETSKANISYYTIQTFIIQRKSTTMSLIMRSIHNDRKLMMN